MARHRKGTETKHINNEIMKIMKMHTARNTTSVRTGIRNSRHMEVPAFQFLFPSFFPA